MFKIASPISTFFEDSNCARKITEKSDCLECRDKSLNSQFPNQNIFHCEIQPIHQLCKDDFSYLEKIATTKTDLKLITFHAASSCNKPHIDRCMFQPGGIQYHQKEMFQNAKTNFSRIKAIFGQAVKIALENNNYYPTEAYRYITDVGFIRKVVYENDIFFLFDISHAKVTAHNRNLNYKDYRNNLPLDKMIQIHICGFTINEDNLAYDTHNLPSTEEWEEVRSLILAHRNTEYITVEYYKDKNNLIKSLEKARTIINELS